MCGENNDKYTVSTEINNIWLYIASNCIMHTMSC